MRIDVPVGLIAIFMALYFFYAFIRIRKRKKEQRQQRHAGMLDALLEMLKNKPH